MLRIGGLYAGEVIKVDVFWRYGKMKVTKLLILAMVLHVFVAASFALYDVPVAGDPAWGIDWRGTDHPTAGGQFSSYEYYAGLVAQTQGDEAFGRVLSGDGAYAYYTATSWDASATTGFTVETRFRTVTGGSTTAFSVLAGSESGYAYFNIVGNPGDPTVTPGVTLHGASTTALFAMDTSGFRVYRMTIQGTTASLYVDGCSTPILTVGTTSAADAFYWGDASAGASVFGDVDYVRATTQGAFAPIPEPATITLLGFAGLALLKRNRSK